MHKQIAGIIFDIDGCLIRGETVIPGAPDTVRKLKGRGIKVAYLTNGNMEATDLWIGRLRRLGFDVENHEIITSVVIAAEYVKSKLPSAKILPVGTEAMIAILRERGLSVLDWDSAGEANVIVMGRDPDFNQKKLEIVCRAIWNGAKFIATNLDRRLPVEDGFIPETGPMVKAVAWATGRNPLVVGKPSRMAGKIALKLLGVPSQQALVVGDNLHQDIKMGKIVGMHTALVLSGCTTENDVIKVSERLRPDVALPEVNHLPAWLDARSVSN